MARLLSTVFAALLFAAVSASVLRPASRQVGDVNDVVGKFNVVQSLSSRGCPINVEHLSAPDGNSIPHSAIEMNGNPCDDDGQMSVLSDAGVASEAVTEVNAKNTIQAIIDQIRDSEQNVTSTLIFGLDRQGRQCGTRNIDELESNSLIIIARTTQDIFTSSFGLIRSDFRYMWILYGETQVCRYQARLRPSPTPTNSAAPSTTPSADADAPVTPPTVPTSAASPSAAAASIAPTPSASTGDDDGTDTDAVETPTDDGEGGDGSGTGAGDGTGGGDGTGAGADASDDDDAAPTEEPGDDSVCFPADSTVELENGSTKRMSEVSIGDRVRVGPNEFSDVFMFSHKMASVRHAFVTLRTSSGDVFSATPKHYIYINDRLAAIESAKEGDSITRADGASSQVVSIVREQKTGLFNPHTVQGDIIVNNVRASTFTQHVESCTATALMMPLRMAYKAFGMSVTFLHNGANKIASSLPNGASVVA